MQKAVHFRTRGPEEQNAQKGRKPEPGGGKLLPSAGSWTLAQHTHKTVCIFRKESTL